MAILGNSFLVKKYHYENNQYKNTIKGGTIN